MPINVGTAGKAPSSSNFKRKELPNVVKEFAPARSMSSKSRMGILDIVVHTIQQRCVVCV